MNGGRTGPAVIHRDRGKRVRTFSKIVLIGFMGTGKTSVGRALARKLGWKFLDADTIIEKRERRKISSIFRAKGEAYFRNVESQVIKDLSRLKNVVVSAGGGAVLRKENVKRLRKNGITVCLRASPASILFRLRGDTTRPLLRQKDRVEVVKRLLRLRRPYYQVADYFVTTDSLTVPDIVGKIIRRLTITRRKG